MEDPSIRRDHPYQLRRCLEPLGGAISLSDAHLERLEALGVALGADAAVSNTHFQYPVRGTTEVVVFISVNTPNSLRVGDCAVSDGALLPEAAQTNSYHTPS